MENRFSNSSDLITYTETKTTLFSNENIPQLITVDELNTSVGDYHIIDIREEFDYKSGHIQGAKNWSWADIKNNGNIINPSINPHNELCDIKNLTAKEN